MRRRRDDHEFVQNNHWHCLTPLSLRTCNPAHANLPHSLPAHRIASTLISWVIKFATSAPLTLSQSRLPRHVITTLWHRQQQIHPSRTRQLSTSARRFPPRHLTAPHHRGDSATRSSLSAACRPAFPLSIAQRQIHVTSTLRHPSHVWLHDASHDPLPLVLQCPTQPAATSDWLANLHTIVNTCNDVPLTKPDSPPLALLLPSIHAGLSPRHHVTEDARARPRLPFKSSTHPHFPPSSPSTPPTTRIQAPPYPPSQLRYSPSRTGSKIKSTASPPDRPSPSSPTTSPTTPPRQSRGPTPPPTHPRTTPTSCPVIKLTTYTR
ncbi:hypothetical protein R3P38DRAFT_3252997 [Favolaschia claudopus]|uniref:Uncharacterized protein n=1 Tax=Favolaschia claudopus TaxID=2862362 RepID=A0AAW0E2W1_9AGAR